MAPSTFFIQSGGEQVPVFDQAVREEVTVQLAHLIKSFLEAAHPAESLFTDHQVDMRMRLLDLVWIPVFSTLRYMILNVKIINNLGDL